MRTVGLVIRARRNQFDGVRTEHREVANVLIPDWNVPRVVGIRLWAIAKLMAPQRVFRRGGSRRMFDIQCGALATEDCASQDLANAEQQPTFVGANDADPAAVGILAAADRVALASQ